MPPRRNRWNDDRPIRRRKKGANTGLIVGLSIGGAVLLIAVIVLIVVMSGRRSRDGEAPGSGDVPNLVKPKGSKTVDHLQEADDPAIVDRTWARLTGIWDPIGNPDASVITFLTDYRYRLQWNDRGESRDDYNPVTVIRDDRGTTSDKTGDCVTLFYHARNVDGSGHAGGDTINFYRDGTIDISGTRYRRRK